MIYKTQQLGNIQGGYCSICKARLRGEGLANCTGKGRALSLGLGSARVYISAPRSPVQIAETPSAVGVF